MNASSSSPPPPRGSADSPDFDFDIPSNPLANPVPPVQSLLPPLSDLVDKAVSFQVAAGGQCGGSTSYCANLIGSQCKDDVWAGAQVLDFYRYLMDI